METMSPLADKKARMRFNKAMREKGLGAKACSRCFVVKGLTQYNASRAKSDGRVTTCKPCMVVTARKWDETNRERRVEIGRQWRETNRERKAETDRQWREANRERQVDAELRWREKNPEAYLAAHRLKSAKRRALKKSATLVPFTVDEMLASWAEDDLYGCAFCGGPYEEIEHLVPLSRGGEHSLANIVPSCIECNRGVGGKHARDPWEWLAERFPNLAPILLSDVDDAPAQ